MSYKITTIIEEDGKITTDDSNQELEEIKNSIPTKLSQLENNCNFINIFIDILTSLCYNN